MSKELELSGKTPLTKRDIEALSIDLLNPVLEGEVDPVSHAVKLKAMQETIKRTLDDDRMKDAVLSEIEKYGKERSWNGATVKIKETGVSYDHSNCNDPVYARLIEERMLLDAKIKEREAFLKTVPDNTTVIDDETGEIYTIHPAIRMAKTSYSITFNRQ